MYKNFSEETRKDGIIREEARVISLERVGTSVAETKGKTKKEIQRNQKYSPKYGLISSPEREIVGGL